MEHHHLTGHWEPNTHLPFEEERWLSTSSRTRSSRSRTRRPDRATRTWRPTPGAVSITTVGAEVDVTAFSSTGHVERLGGLIDGSIDIDFFQDFDADSVYDTLKEELGKVIEIKVKPVDDTTAATNPEWTIKALVTEVPVHLRRRRRGQLVQRVVAVLRGAVHSDYTLMSGDDTIKFDRFESKHESDKKPQEFTMNFGSIAGPRSPVQAPVGYRAQPAGRLASLVPGMARPASVTARRSASGRTGTWAWSGSSARRPPSDEGPTEADD